MKIFYKRIILVKITLGFIIFSGSQTKILSQDLSVPVNTPVCTFSLSNSSLKMDTSEFAHYYLFAQKEKDSVYFVGEIIVGMDTAEATAPDEYPNDNDAVLDSYLQQTMYRIDQSDMILHKSIQGLPPSTIGREYIIEGKVDEEDYLNKGFVIIGESYFISLNMIYHSSEQVYAENYIDLVYQSLTLL